MRDLEFWSLEEMIIMCSELESRVSLEILVLVQKLLFKMIQIRMIMYTDGRASVLFHWIAETSMFSGLKFALPLPLPSLWLSVLFDL